MAIYIALTFAFYKFWKLHFIFVYIFDLDERLIFNLIWLNFVSKCSTIFYYILLLICFIQMASFDSPKQLNSANSSAVEQVLTSIRQTYGLKSMFNI